MTRVTRTELRNTVALLQAAGCDLSIQWAYGRPRISSRDGTRELSPRLSTGSIAIWIHGYMAGLTQVEKKG